MCSIKHSNKELIHALILRVWVDAQGETHLRLRKFIVWWAIDTKILVVNHSILSAVNNN